jgi:glyoxylase-like metal-dependent hydrolase (beta-lactamase superfamily II)
LLPAYQRNFANGTGTREVVTPLLPVRGWAEQIGSLEPRSVPASRHLSGTPEGGRPVLVAGFPAGSFAANCYLVATGPGAECLIIDPGEDAEPGIAEIVARHRLRPVAVLLTHGHIDHVWSVAPVCGAKGIPAYIHPGDRALLTDPARGLSLRPGAELFGGLTFSEPDDVRELTDGTVLSLAGLEITVDHAPGHTPGSVAFRSGTSVMFSGDLQFAGSIGRTDLPGGDPAAMMDSLARVCLTLPDETAVLPGHGPQTTIGAERASNQFLAGLRPGAGPGAQPARPGRATGL